MKQKSFFIVLMGLIGSLVFTADLIAKVTKVKVRGNKTKPGDVCNM